MVHALLQVEKFALRFKTEELAARHVNAITLAPSSSCFQTVDTKAAEFEAAFNAAKSSLSKKKSWEVVTCCMSTKWTINDDGTGCLEAER